MGVVRARWCQREGQGEQGKGCTDGMAIRLLEREKRLL